MGKRYEVTAKVTVYVETWVDDDEKFDLNDQAYDQVRDLVCTIEHTCVGSGDNVELGDIEITSISLNTAVA